MTKSKEEKPARVPEKAKPDGEIQIRWNWVEPAVWTERMLTALEKGVKGGKWFSLIDKVYSKANLTAAYKKVAKNKGAAGVDHQTIEMLKEHLTENIEYLSIILKDGKYCPKEVKRVWIPKPGSKEKRPLGIPTVRDRIVQTALRNVIEPIFERDFAEHSYGFRPKRGCKDALRMVDKLLKTGNIYVVDVDIKSYFDTINHKMLIELIRQKVSDNCVINLIEMFLKQEILDEVKGWIPEKGSPQGAVISPLLSNIYLDPLDHKMVENGREMIRYADDFVILCNTREEAEQALREVQEWTEKAELKLHPEKTRVVNAAEEEFEFLGYKFKGGKKFPSNKSLKKFREKIRAKTKRANGQSLTRIISEVNVITKGWFEYFKHSYKWTFRGIDGWIRMRLRSILRSRRGGKGRGRGKDHQRWPNKFFAKSGLFSLEMAHKEACQSIAG